MAALESAVDGTGWRGALSLTFAASDDRTYVARRRHEGPFCIQQPFYPPDGVCHVYLLHPPGGLAGGDELVLDVVVENGASALLTTPASTKFYRSDGAPSVQTQSFRVAAGASLEWLPQDSILFGGSRAVIATEFHLERGARFAAWEMTALGRPLSGDLYREGRLEQRTHIYVDGEPQLLERLRWRAGEPLLGAAWGLAEFGVCGTLYVYPADDELLALVRERLGAAAPSIDDDDAPGEAAARRHAAEHTGLRQRTGATLLGTLLVIRCLGARAEDVRATFEALWADARPAAIGRVPSPPRIWKT